MITDDYWQKVADEERTKNKLLLETISKQLKRIEQLQKIVREQHGACCRCREVMDE